MMEDNMKRLIDVIEGIQATMSLGITCKPSDLNRKKGAYFADVCRRRTGIKLDMLNT